MSLQVGITSGGNDGEYEDILDGNAFARRNGRVTRDRARPTSFFQARLKGLVAVFPSVATFVVTAVVHVTTGRDAGEISRLELDAVTSATAGCGNVVRTTVGVTYEEDGFGGWCVRDFLRGIIQY